MTRNEFKQRLEELRSQAADRRRSVASRKQSAEEFKRLVALVSQKAQDQGGGNDTTPPKPWVQKTGFPPRSIFDDPKPEELSSGPKIDLDAEPDEPTERPDPWKKKRRELLEYLHETEALGDEERIAFAHEQLAELDARDAEPGEVEEPEYPKPSGPTGIQVDFAGRHVARSIEDYHGAGTVWDRYPAQEIAKSAKRIPGAGPRIVKSWGEDW